MPGDLDEVPELAELAVQVGLGVLGEHLDASALEVDVVLVHHLERALDGGNEPEFEVLDGKGEGGWAQLRVQLLLALLHNCVEGFVHAEVVVFVGGVTRQRTHLDLVC